MKVDNDAKNSQWTYEYAISFIAGPFCGAFLAGVVFNMLNYNADLIKNYVPKKKRDKRTSEQDLNSDLSHLSVSQSASYIERSNTARSTPPRP